MPVKGKVHERAGSPVANRFFCPIQNPEPLESNIGRRKPRHVTLRLHPNPSGIRRVSALEALGLVGIWTSQCSGGRELFRRNYTGLEPPLSSSDSSAESAAHAGSPFTQTSPGT